MPVQDPRARPSLKQTKTERIHIPIVKTLYRRPTQEGVASPQICRLLENAENVGFLDMFSTWTNEMEKRDA